MRRLVYSYSANLAAAPAALEDISGRQSTKRRHERLVDRFGRMPPIEGHHVLHVLNMKFDSGARDNGPAMATL